MIKYIKSRNIRQYSEESKEEPIEQIIEKQQCSYPNCEMEGYNIIETESRATYPSSHPSGKIVNVWVDENYFCNKHYIKE